MFNFLLKVGNMEGESVKCTSIRKSRALWHRKEEENEREQEGSKENRSARRAKFEISTHVFRWKETQSMT